MADDIDRKLIDKRVAHRYLRKGRLDEKEWKKHLESLPDLADQAVPIESGLEDEDEDEDELDDLDEEPQEAAAPAAEPAPAGTPQPEGGPTAG